MATIKLYNCSPLPDEPMSSLLTAASRLVGAQGGVVVKVTRGGDRCISHAKRCMWVARWFLERRRETQKGSYKRGWVGTNGGYVEIKPRISYRDATEYVERDGQRVLLCRTAVDGRRTAEAFFRTAVHEFAHINQYQSGFGRFSSAGNGGRRPSWGKRPEEIDAQNQTEDALQKLARQKARKQRIDELIVSFGIQLEGWRRG